MRDCRGVPPQLRQRYQRTYMQALMLRSCVGPRCNSLAPKSLTRYGGEGVRALRAALRLSRVLESAVVYLLARGKALQGSPLAQRARH